MHYHRSIIVTIICSIALTLAIDSSQATPKQYQQGFNVGAAHGRKIGIEDGSGKSGTNAMHVNATCSIETPRNRDFDRGYVAGCTQAYERAFLNAYRQRKK